MRVPNVGYDLYGEIPGEKDPKSIRKIKNSRLCALFFFYIFVYYVCLDVRKVDEYNKDRITSF